VFGIMRLIPVSGTHVHNFSGETTTSFVLGSTCNANIETLWKSFGVPQLSSNGQLQVDALDLTPTCQAAVSVKRQF
jgi:hypothetical protein